MEPIKLRTRPQQIRFGLGLLFSLLVIGWAIWALDWPAVWQALRQVHYGWVGLAVALNFLAFITRSIRWGFLLGPQPLLFKARFDALIIGQAANYISPARVGDLLRAYVLNEATGVSKAQALGTIALEKLWDLAMLFLFTAALSWFFPLPDWLLDPARGLLVLTLLAVLGVGLLLWRQTRTLTWLTQMGDRLLPRLRDRLVRLSQNTLAGFAGARDPRLAIQIGGWSFIVWVIGGLLNYVVFLAFDLPLSLIPAFLLLIVLQVGVAVPSLPGRIGIFQGICVLVLAMFDIPYDLAFSYGLILHLVVFLPPILLGAVLSLRLNLNFGRASPFNHD